MSDSSRAPLRKAKVVAKLIMNHRKRMARSKMTQATRLERLEREVAQLRRAVRKVAPSREDERVRARVLVLQHLRKHDEIDGWKFAIKHHLVFNDVEEALDDLQKMGSVERVDDE